MQSQSLLAGLRALVEQIDQIERQNAAPVAVGQSYPGDYRAPVAQATMSRRSPSSRAAGIVQRLGVSQNDLFRVANAVGRNGYAAY